jgi:hypothetical protein
MSKYIAFLLRIWPGGNPEQPAWRAALEDPHTRQVLAFNSIEKLCDHLRSLAMLPPHENPSPTIGDVEFPPQDLPRQE